MQCCNGHIACAACCEKLKGQECPYCRSRPFPQSRCLAVEKILESLLTSCRYAAQGCTQMVKFAKKEEHEKECCEYRPFQCPVPKCTHGGLKLAVPEHFGSHVHADQIVRLDPMSRNVKFRMADFKEPYVLVIADEGVLLLVHHLTRTRLPGDLFFCTSFGSNSKSYRLKVKVTGGSSFFTIETLALNNQEKEETWQKSEFLLVPNVNGRRNRQFDLDLLLIC